MRLKLVDDSGLCDASSATDDKRLRLFAEMARSYYEAMVTLNLAIMNEFDVPPLYGGGIRYEPEGMDEIVSCATVVARGWGSCGHLAAYRVAELRHAGKYGAFALRFQGDDPNGTPTYHVIVRLDGSLSPKYEDPSEKLGMRSF